MLQCVRSSFASSKRKFVMILKEKCASMFFLDGIPLREPISPIDYEEHSLKLTRQLALIITFAWLSATP